MSKFLNTPLEPLEKPIPVKGYDRRTRKPISSILQVHLRVNGRRLYNMPFLVTDLGNHSVILGRKWMSYLDILLDVRNRQLIWPTNLQATPSFVREITVALESLLHKDIDTVHQADALRRDRALEKEIQAGKVQILRRPQGVPALVLGPRT